MDVSRSVRVEPDNRYFALDHELGYVPLAGKRKVVIDNSFSFTQTILGDHTRITHPVETYQTYNNKDSLWVFGCSFTFGDCDDNETYPWLLQEKMQNYEVVNFGCPAYSTLQSLMQFKRALAERKIPKIVIVAYASFHETRNSAGRRWRKDFARNIYLKGLRYPYARIGKDGRIRYYRDRMIYKEFPLIRHSAFINWLEDKYNNRIEELFIHSYEISKSIIGEFNDLCKRNKIKLIVADIYSHPIFTNNILKWCEKEKISTLDISVDLKRKEYINSPCDNHPSVGANKEYAEKLYSFIMKML